MAAPPPKIPAGGAGKAPNYGSAAGDAAAGMNEEGELTKDEWDEKVTADITTKPIFLIVVHGSYDETVLTSSLVKVPDGCMVLELSTITEMLKTKCGSVGNPLRALLKNSEKTAQVVTASAGDDISDIVGEDNGDSPDIRLLHQSAKYIDTDTYYQRWLSLSLHEFKHYPSIFYIDKFFKGKITKKSDIAGWLAQRTASEDRVYSNELIERIKATDEDSHDGCICILVTCANVTTLNALVPYNNIVKKHEMKRFKGFLAKKFKFNETPHGVTRKKSKKPNDSIFIYPTASAIVGPEESLYEGPKSEKYTKQQKYQISETGISYKIPGLRTGYVGTENLPVGPRPVYPSSTNIPKLLKTIPTNIEHTQLLINGRSYFIGRGNVELPRNEIVKVVSLIRRMRRSTKKETQRKAPKRVLLFYRGKWIPVKI